jgi:hypothetical protein
MRGKEPTHTPSGIPGGRGTHVDALFFLGLLVGIWYADLALASETLVGKWNTIDEKNGKVTSEVELYEQAGKLFGKMPARAQ